MTSTTLDIARSPGTVTRLAGLAVEPLLGVLTQAFSRPFRSMQSARPSLASREAAEVRELAHRYRDTDRGFAADLYVAADRHEEAARAKRPGSAADRR